MTLALFLLAEDALQATIHLQSALRHPGSLDDLGAAYARRMAVQLRRAAHHAIGLAATLDRHADHLDHLDGR